MTPDPRDELAALDHTSRERTHEDVDASFGVARIRWDDEIAFLPLDPEDAERQRLQRETVGRSLVWDNIRAMYQRMFCATLCPSDPWAWIPYIDPTDPGQVASARAAAEAYADYMKGQSTEERPRSLYEGNWTTQEPG